jgi:NAD(P)H-hydrate epimerase
VDADALNVLARLPSWAKWIGGDVVMTPHIGELRRLAPTEDLATPPWEIARRYATAWGVTLVVKGAFTGIGSQSEAWVNACPNPALATGGTGDILTGIIGGLLARGLQPQAAARLGVWVHSQAGERAARGLSAGGLMASDLLPEIPRALAAVVGTPTVGDTGPAVARSM